MKLSTLKKPHRPTAVPIDFSDGDRLNVVYDRAVVTDEWNELTMTRIERLSQLLISWDLTDDDGKPFQPAENLNGDRAAAWAALLKEIPPDMRRYIEDQIWADYFAGKPLGGGSTAT